ncbi:MAG: exodeoxyribonuclease VII small subunit [Oscillospiraceae bacterium]|nr:exodeoxyribonuclease VII small subunit [Oscillospiraceae bacterium]MDE7172557.1 exodeoxyribonuclease VII small subunit [Oscillospiraceae bacterium]
MAVKKQSFEESMARLEAIVAQLEKGECGLDQSLKLFEEGAKLTGQCEELLDKAEQKVNLLLANDQEVPFEEEANEL